MEDALVFKNRSSEYDCAISVKIDNYSHMNVCFARMPDTEISNVMYELTNYPLIEMYEDECEFDIASNKSSITVLKRERNIYNFDVAPIHDAVKIAVELRDTLTDKFEFKVRLVIVGNDKCKFIKAKAPKS